MGALVIWGLPFFLRLMPIAIGVPSEKCVPLVIGVPSEKVGAPASWGAPTKLPQSFGGALRKMCAPSNLGVPSEKWVPQVILECPQKKCELLPSEGIFQNLRKNYRPPLAIAFSFKLEWHGNDGALQLWFIDSKVDLGQQ